MNSADLQRYERQIRLPQIGAAGQKILGQASVLITGAGGLGSVTALYLTAAGIGRILIADHDQVELSNLNRQLLHREKSLGVAKAESAARQMKQLNSTIQIIPIHKKITEQTIEPLLDGIDLMVDGTDNFATRKILNRTSLAHNLPWVFGGVCGFDGMVSSFIPGRTACFECVVPEPKHPDPEPGVVGPAAGITASIQAMEVIKHLLGIGRCLENRMVRISGLDMRIHTISFEKDPDCRICNPSKS